MNEEMTVTVNFYEAVMKLVDAIAMDKEWVEGDPGAYGGTYYCKYCYSDSYPTDDKATIKHEENCTLQLAKEIHSNMEGLRR